MLAQQMTNGSKPYNVILLTATITPPSDVPLLARTDPKLRLQDYEKALQFYVQFIGKGIDAIVFAENSQSDISSLQNIVNAAGVKDQVEFLVFAGLDHPASYGRAYGEFKLMNYAMANSQIITNHISSHQENLLVWKVTGRYIIRNFARILSKCPKRIDLYVNLRKVPIPWSDMYLMVWTPKGHELFLSKILNDMIAESSFQVQPEQVFYQLLDRPLENLRVRKRFNVIPLIDGARGSDNQNYSQGKNLRKFYIRSLANTLFPWLWI